MPGLDPGIHSLLTISKDSWVFTQAEVALTIYPVAASLRCADTVRSLYRARVRHPLGPGSYPPIADRPGSSKSGCPR